MKKRDVYLPSLTSIIIASMMMFLSCASQNRVKDELDVQAEMGDEVQEEQIVEESSGEQPIEEVAEQAVEQSPEQSEDLSLEGDPQLAELSQVESAEAAAQNPDLTQNAEATQTPTDNGAADLTSLENIDPQATPPTETIQPEGGNVGGDLENAELAAAAATTEVTQQPSSSEPVIGAEPEITEPQVAVAAEPEPTVPTFQETQAQPAQKRTFSGHSRVPKIPQNAVTRKGDKLNRFYFVRQGDTPQSLSQLFYGSEDHASHLKKWNGGSWTAGRIVYYSSPIEATDSQMHSFYQERNVTPEEYTVERGDWLSKVAQKKLGSHGSWKEIAVINDMSKPDALEVGQKLAMYPKDLSGFGGAPQVAQNEPPVQPEEQPTQAKVEPVQQEPVQPQVAPVEPPPVAVEPPQAKQAPVEPEGLDGSKFIEQNALAIVILGAAMVLLLALLMRRKKTAKLGDEFNEDNFAPPTKLKRK
jgi:hypothetical protein